MVHHNPLNTRPQNVSNTPFTPELKSGTTTFLNGNKGTPLHRGCGRGRERSERVGPDDVGELAVLRPRDLGGGLLRLPRPGAGGVGRFGRGCAGPVGQGGGGPARSPLR